MQEEVIAVRGIDSEVPEMRRDSTAICLMVVAQREVLELVQHGVETHFAVVQGVMKRGLSRRWG